MKKNGTSAKSDKAPAFVARAERALHRAARNVKAQNRALKLPELAAVLLIVAGLNSAGLRRHARFPTHTPMTNLCLAMLERIGVPGGTAGRQHGSVEGTGLN